MSPVIYLLNGPNLNLLGERKPEIYGRDTLSDIEKAVETYLAQHGYSLKASQSNSEGEIIDNIQAARIDAKGLIINPGAYSHTSIAIRDAIEAFSPPVIEVHLSNIHAREEFRAHSYVSEVATAVVCGFGAHGYILAAEGLLSIIQKATTN